MDLVFKSSLFVGIPNNSQDLMIVGQEAKISIIPTSICRLPQPHLAKTVHWIPKKDHKPEEGIVFSMNDIIR